ncbi:MAG: T9SS type A sorting domain-containing protein [Candidatus Firestonebacteria bacterium]|nr:T9SS type A sorting domain-containing protein [Candidatus Firestonebacteria bacterium]
MGTIPADANTDTALMDMRFLPTTDMFLTAYGGGKKDTWTGHTAIIKNPLPDPFGTTNGNTPVIYVMGGGANTFSAYADGNGDTNTPAGAYSSVYKSNVDSNGALLNWSSDATHGVMPMASILHTSVVTVNHQAYVIGGANSGNANIFAGAASRSDTVYYGIAPTDWYNGHADVFYENIGAGSTSGNFEVTSFIPLKDPNWSTDNPAAGWTGGDCYQPLIRAASVTVNGVIYVLGGISRVNQLPVVSHPAIGMSDADVQDKVWYAIPNPGGSINALGGPNGWTTTTPLPQHLYDVAACAFDNRIYVFGGRDAHAPVNPSPGSVSVHTPLGNPLNTVYFSNLNSDGSLGAWAATTPMLLNLAEHQVVFTSGRIYVLGGSSDAAGGTLRNTILYCMPNATTGQIPFTHNLGDWQFLNAALEHPVAGHQAATNNDHIYVLGGRYNGVQHSSNAYYSVYNTMTPTMIPTETVTSTIIPTLTATPNFWGTQFFRGSPFLAYPNPAKDEVRFVLPGNAAGEVKVWVYNLSGERVAIINGSLAVNRDPVVVWNCHSLAPGIYLVSLQLNGREIGKNKLAIIR